MASLGGYSLKAVKRGTGREGGSFFADVYYKGKKIAEFRDYGDGGMEDVTFFNENYYPPSKALEDMQLLVKGMGHRAEPDELWKTFLYTNYSALSGFVSLLDEIRDLEAMSKRVQKELHPHEKYCVALIGGSWWGRDKNSSATISGLGPSQKDNSDEAFLARMRKVASTKGPGKRPARICAIAYLTGPMVWDLDFSDYRDLFTVE